MNKIFRAISVAAMLLLGAASLNALTAQEAVTACLEQYMPGTSGFSPKVKSVKINDARKTITVACNVDASYIPLSKSDLADLKNNIRKALGQKYDSFNVNITADGVNLDNLVRFATSPTGPTETEAFVTRCDAPLAPDGLDGANIALWQSHGWYFEPKLNRWEWQRARVQQTVEDLYTQSYVMPFLMPMLENAGAYVMSPRERDINLNEVIIDNDGRLACNMYAEQGSWSNAEKPGFAYLTTELTNDQNPFREGTTRISTDDSAYASWNADIPQSGTYAVYVSYATTPESTSKAIYKINAADGTHTFHVNQRMGGGTWIYLGHFPLNKGIADRPIVELGNGIEGTALTADDVKIGGGMGNVARIVKEPLDSIDYQYVLSGRPRWNEGARYFLQWAGAPDSIYTPSGNINDYGDDYKCRGEWVNWLTGGSSMYPGREGLNIPVDLSLAFHTDAGTTLNDDIIGTLGIYCTAGDTLGNGNSRLASRDYTDLIMTNIVDDVRASFEPKWARRGMWDQSYYEARVPRVPAMLLELLSHQNFADMKYGLDPTFRFTVSRAIYKGMLKFLAARDARDYVVQPLPVRSFAISHPDGGDQYTLTWLPTDDKQEPTAAPTYYLVQERVDDGAFRTVATVTEPEWITVVADNDIHSYRIIAGNNGGISFPSEVLALCNLPRAKQEVMIVNGFTRVSAPDWFDSGEIAGFYDTHDGGVPYVYDISYIGQQFEFRRDIPWMDDDASGFGASRANYEDKVIAGNTFDYPYIHGKAIREAGHGFISMSAEAFEKNGCEPLILDLILGKQKETKRGTGAYGTDSKTFSDDMQKQLRDYTAKGGSIFTSGAYVASDLWDNPYSTDEQKAKDQTFAREVLGFNWRVDQASVTGEAYQVPCRFKELTTGEYTFSNEYNEDMYAVESPDSLYPADDASACTFMRYSENNLIAGTALSRPAYRAVVIGFPFETIYGDAPRANLMKQVLKFLATPRN